MFGDFLQAISFIDALARKKAVPFAVLIRHQRVFRTINEKRHHAHVLTVKIFSQLIERTRNYFGSANEFLLQRFNAIGFWHPEIFAEAPVTRVIKEEYFVDAFAEQFSDAVE